jgi:hypothetical protein
MKTRHLPTVDLEGRYRSSAALKEKPHGRVQIRRTTHGHALSNISLGCNRDLAQAGIVKTAKTDEQSIDGLGRVQIIPHECSIGRLAGGASASEETSPMKESAARACQAVGDLSSTISTCVPVEPTFSPYSTHEMN